MAEHLENRILRPIRVITDRAILDGLLTVYLGSRTQDELNAAGRPFLTLSSPLVVAGDIRLEDGPIVVSKASIILAMEVPELGATLDKSPGTGLRSRGLGHFDCSVIRLGLGPYHVEGYVYITPGGNTMARVTQTSHPFIILTTATVTGLGIDICLPFVMVNRSHIFVAQELFEVGLVQEESSAGGGAA